MVALDGDTLLALRLGAAGSAVVAPQEATQPLVTSAVINQSRLYALSVAVPAGGALEVRRIELATYPVPRGLRGIAYSPFRDCQYPGGEAQPSAAEVRADLLRIRHTANAVRTYSSRGANATAAFTAAELGLAVYPSASLDGPVAGETLADSTELRRTDAAEIDSLLALARSLPLAGVVVGNEFVLRHSGEWEAGRPHPERSRRAAEHLAGSIRAVKARLGGRSVPVGTAEILAAVFDLDGPGGPSLRPEYRVVLDEVDFLFIHVYPFWDGRRVDEAVGSVLADYPALVRTLAEAYPRVPKRLLLGETGWPSAGIAPWAKTVGAAGTHLRSARYLSEFLAAADGGEIDFFYFAFADELWKAKEGVQGQAWGLLNADRTAKLPVQSVLLPSGELPPAVIAPEGRWPELAPPCRGGRRVCVYDEWMYPESVAVKVEGGARMPSRYEAVPDSAVEHVRTDYPLFLPSGFIGDAAHVRLIECARESRVHGQMAARAALDLRGPEGWGGVAWLAAGRWDAPGIDLRARLRPGSAERLVLRFWARGRDGGERVRFGATDQREVRASTDWVELTREWLPVELELGRLDPARVVAGFWWVADREHNRGRREVELLIDDVRYEVR